MLTYTPWGKSVAINLYDCDTDLLDNGEELRRFIQEVIEIIKMVAHGDCHVEKFGDGALHGYSGMQFIETSSITVHLDQPGRRAFVDIFSCKDFDVECAVKFAKRFYKAGGADSATLIR